MVLQRKGKILRTKVYYYQADLRIKQNLRTPLNISINKWDILEVVDPI